MGADQNGLKYRLAGAAALHQERDTFEGYANTIFNIAARGLVGVHPSVAVGRNLP